MPHHRRGSANRCAVLWAGGDESDPLVVWLVCIVSAAGRALVLRHSHTLGNKGREKRWPSSVGLTLLVCLYGVLLTTCHPTSFYKVAEVWICGFSPWTGPFGSQNMITLVLPVQEDLKEFAKSCYIEWQWNRKRCSALQKKVYKILMWRQTAAFFFSIRNISFFPFSFLY